MKKVKVPGTPAQILKFPIPKPRIRGRSKQVAGAAVDKEITIYKWLYEID